MDTFTFLSCISVTRLFNCISNMINYCMNISTSGSNDITEHVRICPYYMRRQTLVISLSSLTAYTVTCLRDDVPARGTQLWVYMPRWWLTLLCGPACPTERALLSMTDWMCLLLPTTTLLVQSTLSQSA